MVIKIATHTFYWEKALDKFSSGFFEGENSLTVPMGMAQGESIEK